MADKVYHTPIFQKIGLKLETKLAILGGPDFFIDQVVDNKISFDTDILFEYYDVIIVFNNSRVFIENNLDKLKNSMTKTGMIWWAWYKKSAKMPGDLNENIIRDTAIALGLVDIKVISIDHEWSALKLVIPLKNR